ncbi:MAG: M56 family metallopeptidase [bacterium]|jgi:TonB family protein
MIAGIACEQIWRGVASHLWQTTLVLLALLVIARTMNNAPARLRNALWWVGFAKMFMPLALLGHAGRMMMQAMAGPAGASFSFRSIVVTLAGGASYIMEPGLLVVASRPGNALHGSSLSKLITVLWAAGAAYILARLILKARRSPYRDAVALGNCPRGPRRRIEEAASAGGIEPGAVFVSPGEGVPGVSGLLRPRIVIPERAAMELSRDELRAVLLHEDAHRRRREPLRLALQRLALTVFFFYPPLWLLLRELNTSAEMACDEAVLEAGTGPATYMAAIASMLGFGLEEGLEPTALGFGRLSPIRARLERLETNRRFITMRRHRLALLGAVFVVAMLSFIPLVPPADSQPVEVEPPAGPDVVPAPPAPPEIPPEIKPESIAYPEYPEVAREEGIEGDVLLEVTVGADGKVTDVKVVRGVARCPQMEDNAVEAVKKWLFKPALVNGKPFMGRVLIPVEFDLDDSGPIGFDRPPAIIDDLCPLPEYPELARKAGIEGKTIVEVEILADGTVARTAVKQGVPGHPELDEAALDAVAKWRFEPATKDNVPVGVTVCVPIEFRLDGEKSEK